MRAGGSEDLLQFGEVAFVVEMMTDENGKEQSDPVTAGKAVSPLVK